MESECYDVLGFNFTRLSLVVRAKRETDETITAKSH